MNYEQIVTTRIINYEALRRARQARADVEAEGVRLRARLMAEMIVPQFLIPEPEPYPPPPPPRPHNRALRPYRDRGDMKRIQPERFRVTEIHPEDAFYTMRDEIFKLTFTMAPPYEIRSSVLDRCMAYISEAVDEDGVRYVFAGVKYAPVKD